jgi:hypothetical protein
MKLVDVDAVEAQTLQAAFERRAQVLRAAVVLPIARARPREPALGRDDQACRVGKEGFCDQLFADMGAVRIGRVDEVHAARHRMPQNVLRDVAIRRRTPDTRADDAHRSKAHPVDGQVAADAQRPGRSRGEGGLVAHRDVVLQAAYSRSSMP